MERKNFSTQHKMHWINIFYLTARLQPVFTGPLNLTFGFFAQSTLCRARTNRHITGTGKLFKKNEFTIIIDFLGDFTAYLCFTRKQLKNLIKNFFLDVCYTWESIKIDDKNCLPAVCFNGESDSPGEGYTRESISAHNSLKGTIR